MQAWTKYRFLLSLKSDDACSNLTFEYTPLLIYLGNNKKKLGKFKLEKYSVLKIFEGKACEPVNEDLHFPALGSKSHLTQFQSMKIDSLSTEGLEL